MKNNTKGFILHKNILYFITYRYGIQYIEYLIKLRNVIENIVLYVSDSVILNKLIS